MKTVTISVSSWDDVSRRFLAAAKGKNQGKLISFASVELLWQTLTKKRWELLQAMIGEGAMTIRQLARRVGRDVKGVHRDVHALFVGSVLDRTEDHRVVFPYDEVRVEFTLQKTCLRNINRKPWFGPWILHDHVRNRR